MYDLPMTQQGLTGSENNKICIKHFKGISKKRKYPAN